jgi:hypothetical protein
VDTPTNTDNTEATSGGRVNQTRRHRGFGTPLPRWVRIFVATVMLTTGAVTAVTRDILVRWETQIRLQVDANRMAIAGAVFLPDTPARATLAAADSAEQCGLSSSEVVHAGAALDRMSFSVSLRRTAPVLILRLLGSAGTNVTAAATATAHPPAKPHNAFGVPMTLTALRMRAVPSAASGRTALLW